MQNTDRAVFGVDRTHDRVSDGVVTTQAQRQRIDIENFSNMFLDFHQGVGAGPDITISQIDKSGILVEIDAQFGSQVGRTVMHDLANLRGRLGWPSHERRVRVRTESD
jgi:hypothetical protein